MKRLDIGCIAVLALSLVGCEYGERVQGAPQPGEVLPVQGFTWHVVTPLQLQAKYIEYGGELPNQHAVQGFVAKRESDGARMIYTTAPKYVDDTVACTLGHEVMHLAIGNFHKEKVIK